ncbi:MAG: hypothetical protein EPN91_05585 [Salinibacterium sp.]|nr:MAG: hypothetical protein EPN91_05585 [Salinibacterium sp.]
MSRSRNRRPQQRRRCSDCSTKRSPSTCRRTSQSICCRSRGTSQLPTRKCLYLLMFAPATCSTCESLASGDLAHN